MGKFKQKNIPTSIISALILAFGALCGIIISPFIIPQLDLLKLKKDDLNSIQQNISSYWAYVIKEDFKSDEYKTAVAKLEFIIDTQAFDNVLLLESNYKVYADLKSKSADFISKYNACKRLFFPSTGIAFAMTGKALKELSQANSNIEASQYSSLENQIKLLQDGTKKANSLNEMHDLALTSASYFMTDVFYKELLKECRTSDNLMPGGNMEQVTISKDDFLSLLEHIDLQAFQDVSNNKISSLSVENYINYAMTLRRIEVFNIKAQLKDYFQENFYTTTYSN